MPLRRAVYGTIVYMTLTMNYTYRIYPDAQQEANLLEWLKTCRLSYNYALRELKERRSPTRPKLLCI